MAFCEPSELPVLMPRVGRRTGRSGERIDQMAVDHTRRDEGIRLVDILHDGLVAGREVIGIVAAAQTLRTAELAGRVDRHLPTLGDLDVEIRTEVVAVERRPGAGIVIGVVGGDTVLREVAERHEILHALGAARHVDVDLHLRCHAVEHLLVEVAAGVVERRRTLELLALLGRKIHGVHLDRRIVAVVLELPQIVVVEDVGRQTLVAGEAVLFVADRLVAQQGVFVGIHALLQGRSTRETVVHGEIDGRRSRVAAARRHDDDAVGASDTVNGRRRRVFQHADTLYFVGIHRIELGHRLLRRLLHTVDDDQRRRRTVGRYAADTDVGGIVARFARSLQAAHAGRVADQRVGDVGHGSGNEVGSLHRRDRTRHVHLLLHGIGRHHDLLGHDGLLLQRHVDDAPHADAFAVRRIADERELQFVVARRLDRIPAVGHRDGTGRGALHHDGNTQQEHQPVQQGRFEDFYHRI